MRIIIDFDNVQLARQCALAKTEKTSRAQAVRRAVDLMQKNAAALRGAGFGLWANVFSMPPEHDGFILQRAMRNEWPESSECVNQQDRVYRRQHRY